MTQEELNVHLGKLQLECVLTRHQKICTWEIYTRDYLVLKKVSS